MFSVLGANVFDDRQLDFEHATEGGDEFVDGTISQLGISRVRHSSVCRDGDAQGAFRSQRQPVIGGLAVDEKAAAFGRKVREFCAGRVALFSNDKQDANMDALVAQTFRSSDLRGDNSLGIAGAPPVNVGIVLAAWKKRRDCVDMGRKHNIGTLTLRAGVDIEAFGRELAPTRLSNSRFSRRKSLVLTGIAPKSGPRHLHCRWSTRCLRAAVSTGPGQALHWLPLESPIHSPFHSLPSAYPTPLFTIEEKMSPTDTPSSPQPGTPSVIQRLRAVEIPGPAGRLEGLVNIGEGEEAPYCALVCHPHPPSGGTMHNKVVYQTMKALTALGLPVLRFNFRGTGLSEGTHDLGRGEVDDVHAALDWLTKEFAKPVIFAGFSFGSNVGLRACCGDGRVKGIISLGVPMHAAGRDYTYRFLPDCQQPKLFISGTNDEFASVESVNTLAASSPHSSVVWVPEADHFFTSKLDRVRIAITEWMESKFDIPGKTQSAERQS